MKLEHCNIIMGRIITVAIFIFNYILHSCWAGYAVMFRLIECIDSLYRKFEKCRGDSEIY